MSAKVVVSAKVLEGNKKGFWRQWEKIAHLSRPHLGICGHGRVPIHDHIYKCGRERSPPGQLFTCYATAFFINDQHWLFSR